MNSIIIFFFCLGIFLIIQGIYQQKYEALKKNVRVEYRFIPKTFYEEQLQQSNVSSLFKNMFNQTENNQDPWFNRTVTIQKNSKN